MELSMRAKHEVIDRSCVRYRKAGKAQKTKILDEFVETTGYVRKYASWVLSHWKQTVVERRNGKVVRFKVGARKALPRSGRPVVYYESFFLVLKDLWFLFDCLCGKRFVAMIRVLLDDVLATDMLACDAPERALLKKVSPATVDRLLASERKRLTPHGSSITRPGSLLKRQIPIRTFADWSDVIPGFFEADLVAHDGGSAFGDFHCTLTMTDVATGWTEMTAVLNKAQIHVFPGLQLIRNRIPFPLLGLDTDNGSEFVNGHLMHYCAQEHITFTRSRPYRKNDGCYVEQKNNSVIRRSVGYARFDSPTALATLNALYERLRLLTNFVYPSAKLIAKTREGSQVCRKHDIPQTPFQRILARQDVSQKIKDALSSEYRRIDPLNLAREFKTLQDSLLPLAAPVTNPFRPYKILHTQASPALP
ncbi:MAG: transposase [Candidatus Shapirobacteria bacterium]|jgi:hypothetical protein